MANYRVCVRLTARMRPPSNTTLATPLWLWKVASGFSAGDRITVPPCGLTLASAGQKPLSKALKEAERCGVERRSRLVCLLSDLVA
jgi:hypothetical protein